MGLCSLNHHSTIIGPDKTFVAIRTYHFLPTFFFSRWWYFSGAERLVSADKFMFTCTLDTIAVTLSQTGCEHGILCITAQYCRQTSSCGGKEDQTWTKSRQLLSLPSFSILVAPVFVVLVAPGKRGCWLDFISPRGVDRTLLNLDATICYWQSGDGMIHPPNHNFDESSSGVWPQ